jgi:Ala-tRNA(Pro) deacylase
MLKTLTDFLDSHKIRYLTMHHSIAYTAQEIAGSVHIHGREFAKSVIVKLDGEMVIVVLPATEKLDTELLAGATNARKAEIASEDEFEACFPKCETGAMPPFGNLFDMDVYLEEEMTSNDRMTFNAGSHTELIQMSMKDFIDLVKPKVVRMCKSYL